MERKILKSVINRRDQRDKFAKNFVVFQTGKMNTDSGKFYMYNVISKDSFTNTVKQYMQNIISIFKEII